MRARFLITACLALGFTPAMAEMDHSQHDMTGHTAHTGASAHIHHSHRKGMWMLEYRFMRMNMNGLLDGTGNVDSRDISGAFPGTPPTIDPTKSYLMAPTKMRMDMHMLMLMYGLTERLSLMGMVNYRDNRMDMVMHMPMLDMSGTMETRGLGDSLLGAMMTLDDRWTTSLSISLPTGGIDETADMTMTGINPMDGTQVSFTSTNIDVSYPMQLGSGTFDLIPAVTYKDSTDKLGWGTQASYILRLGDNDNGYTLGDRFEIFAWGKYVISPSFLVSGKLTFADWGRIDGRDPSIDPQMSPAGDPDVTGGTRADASLGLNCFFGQGHSVGVEFAVPVHQDLNGPQMENDWTLSFTYQYMR